MERIKGECITNLDNFDTSIVSEFCRVPIIGDKVRCLNLGFDDTLYVCAITHDIKNQEPYIIVELTK